MVKPFGIKCGNICPSAGTDDHMVFSFDFVKNKTILRYFKNPIVSLKGNMYL
jgi:hypothetical protein